MGVFDLKQNEVMQRPEEMEHAVNVKIFIGMCNIIPGNFYIKGNYDMPMSMICQFRTIHFLYGVTIIYT